MVSSRGIDQTAET